MGLREIISLVGDVAGLLALVIGTGVGLFVFFQLAPVLQLRILPRWADEGKQFLVVRFEVENGSRVRVQRPRGRIQVLEHRVEPGRFLSHFVPFEAGAIRDEERPIAWREPERIFQHTQQIYPGEVIGIERLYPCRQEAVIVHIGLQVEVEQGFWGRIVTRKGEGWRQTTTCIVVKQGGQVGERGAVSLVKEVAQVNYDEGRD